MAGVSVVGRMGVLEGLPPPAPALLVVVVAIGLCSRFGGRLQDLCCVG